MMKWIHLFPLGFALILGACGGLPAVKSDSAEQSNKAAIETGKAKKGGYYLDDGPGDNPPANIESIPDAVPRVEPLMTRANKPYIALGNSYTPMTEYRPYKQKGIASWYGRRYHGQKTSAGEVYDMYGMTGAHTILPIPSYVRVTNPENQKSVIVRINDRGPFHSDRLIDLSYAASYKLGLAGKGSGLVEVEAIDARNYAAANALPAKPKPAPVEQATVEIKPLQTSENVEPIDGVSTNATTVSAAPVAAADSGVFVQVGAFKSEENAMGLSKKILNQKLVENAPVNSWYNNGTYRVRVGPYASRSEAEVVAAKLKQSLRVNTYIIAQP
jgi:rare lipoprotein A